MPCGLSRTGNSGHHNRFDELASIVKLQIRTIGTLYGMSDYDAPFIGGDPQLHTIAPPPGAARLVARDPGRR